MKSLAECHVSRHRRPRRDAPPATNATHDVRCCTQHSSPRSHFSSSSSPRPFLLHTTPISPLFKPTSPSDPDFSL
ncbi:hypothetical protein E2542_SST23545 [Spatholobus suberectus]|nr:hypothetical protein E2542_SST23545 [Spatholobus suberectus]